MKTQLIAFAAWAALAALPAALQGQTKVFSTGLLNPAKIILGPPGSLLVSEFDVTPNSGRVSIVSSSGVRRTLVDGLPSGVGSNGPDGPTGLVLDGNTLYVAIGDGDELQNTSAADGTQVPNQKAPASPILDTILQIDFGGSVDKITSAFTLKAPDHFVLANGQPVAVDNGSGDKATISMLSQFRYRGDPVTIYRNSHPYALVKSPEGSNRLYLTDAGLNALVQVDLPSGRFRVLTSFPNQPNRGSSGPPTVEAVPDSIEPFGGKLLVTLLTGFPFSPGDSKVLMVDPATGAASVLLDNLTNTVAIAWRTGFFGGLSFYVLQFSNDLLNHGPGQLLLVSAGTTKVVVDNLNGPSAMVLDRPAGRLYITTKAGNLLEYDLPN
jgi:hypothetical protein